MLGRGDDEAVGGTFGNRGGKLVTGGKVKGIGILGRSGRIGGVWKGNICEIFLGTENNFELEENEDDCWR